MFKGKKYYFTHTVQQSLGNQTMRKESLCQQSHYTCKDFNIYVLYLRMQINVSLRVTAKQ